MSFLACLVCSESMQNKSIRYTSVQTVQPVSSDSSNGRKVEKGSNLLHPVDIASSSQLTEEKLLEHDHNVSFDIQIYQNVNRVHFRFMKMNKGRSFRSGIMRRQRWWINNVQCNGRELIIHFSFRWRWRMEQTIIVPFILSMLKRLNVQTTKVRTITGSHGHRVATSTMSRLAWPKMTCDRMARNRMTGNNLWSYGPKWPEV